ncbi:hypothetical protein LIER_12741 [Lithospermum erythrorhizon]|uniref:Uncharacterized protein n=1 Tax=Lithospermum erythrorhizon TaxID=34254 RepID=A0AAV3PXF4_LITER
MIAENGNNHMRGRSWENMPSAPSIATAAAGGLWSGETSSSQGTSPIYLLQKHKCRSSSKNALNISGMLVKVRAFLFLQ